MIVTNVDRGRTIKTVTVEGITFDDSSRSVFNLALEAAGETRSSIFGHHVKSFGNGTVQIALYTD